MTKKSCQNNKDAKIFEQNYRKIFNTKKNKWHFTYQFNQKIDINDK